MQQQGAYPTLRTLQENLPLPFFFSTVAAPPPPPPLMQVGGGGDVGGWSFVGNWPAPENPKGDGTRMAVGSTELDCMWTY